MKTLTIRGHHLFDMLGALATVRVICEMVRPLYCAEGLLQFTQNLGDRFIQRPLRLTDN